MTHLIYKLIELIKQTLEDSKSAYDDDVYNELVQKLAEVDKMLNGDK